MRILLDECVDRRLARDIAGHEARTLRAHSNRLADLRPLVPRLLVALPSARPGQVTWVEGEK